MYGAGCCWIKTREREKEDEGIIDEREYSG